MAKAFESRIGTIFGSWKNFYEYTELMDSLDWTSYR
jgi:hypothetical protein